MEHFIGRNALLWQKLAVTVESDTTVEELQHALKSGATFLHIRCGNYTPPECITILERCNEAIDAYTKLCYPWKMATGIVCELSGPHPRVRWFTVGKADVRVTEEQIITLTGDTRYDSQCFDEVKYVTNFEQLTGSSVGDVLSIGSVKLTVERIVVNFLTCKVTEGGLLKPFSIVTRAPNAGNTEDDGELDLSSSLTELECVTKNGCKFVIVPEMNVKTLRKLLELFKGSDLYKDLQIILRADDSSAFKLLSELEESFHSYLTKNIELLEHMKASGKPVLFHLDKEETPPPIEAADVIIVNGKELARVQDFLRDVNRLQLERNQQPLRTISPDDSALPYCLDFSSKEANASAIILPATSPKLANEICSINPLCNVLVITNSDQELNTLLLRKYAVPILELAASTIPQQRLIRRAIAYGRRFGYLHAGNCIVSGAELESDTDVVGMEVRYVPQVPEALQSESTV